MVPSERHDRGPFTVSTLAIKTALLASAATAAVLASADVWEDVYVCETDTQTYQEAPASPRSTYCLELGGVVVLGLEHEPDRALLEPMKGSCAGPPTGQPI